MRRASGEQTTIPNKDLVTSMRSGVHRRTVDVDEMVSVQRRRRRVPRSGSQSSQFSRISAVVSWMALQQCIQNGSGRG